MRPTRVAGLDVLPATLRLARIARALGRLRSRYDAMVLDLRSSPSAA